MQINLTISEDKKSLPEGLTIMASRTPDTFSILISYTKSHHYPLPLRIKFPSSAFEGQFRFRELTLSNLKTNPKSAWMEVGQPLKSINKAQMVYIRNHSKLQMGQIESNPLGEMELKMASKSVKLIHFCRQNIPMEQPYDIGFHCELEIETLLVYWKYPCKAYCIDSFYLEFSLTGYFWDFHHVEKTGSLNNFHFVSEAWEGWYRIRARSYFGDYGPYSVPIYVSCRKDEM